MASSLQGVTSSTSFLSCTPDQAGLFCVNSGVPVVDALEKASCLLAAAILATDGNGAPSFASGYLVETAKAVVDAVLAGAMHKTNSDQQYAERRYASLITELGMLFDDQALIVNPEASERCRKDAAAFVAWVNEQRKGGAA